MPHQLIRFISSLFIIITPLLLAAQQSPEAQRVIQAVLQRQRQLQRISYTVRSLDTLLTGTTRDRTGWCDMQTDASDSLFGFSFRASRDSIPSCTIYTSGKSFELNTAKHTYTMNLRPATYILGSPGGQMVFQDLVRLDTSRTIKTGVYEENNQYVLRFDYPDITEYEIKERYKLVFIDKERMLPVKSYSHQISIDKRQVVTLHLQSLSLDGDIKSPFDFASKQYLDGFTLEVNAGRKPPYLALLNQPAPAWQLTDFTGKSVALSNLAGKVVLLDFWEVWCTPCVGSMPKIEALYVKYKDKGLAVMGVMCDTAQLASARRLVASKKYSFVQLAGDKGMHKDYKLDAVPLYVLIDKKGVIRYIHAGFEESLEEKIKEVLE